MKCPKCGYLGFEHVERCRNCGYDFSLTEPLPLPELPIRLESQPLGPLEDLSLTGTPTPPPSPSPPGRASRLPLFGGSAVDDEPLITRPSPPRAPLAVRRATPDIPRVREAPQVEPLNLGLEDYISAADLPAPTPSRPVPRAHSSEPVHSSRETGLVDAAPGARLMAVAIDLVILAAIDMIVLYLTMEICGISATELDILPIWPMLAFLVAQNGAYLVVFTAGGQTLGKMTMGIKVVPQHSRASVDWAHALARELLWLVLAVPAGLGFLTILGRDHRGLHDRFAGTRVVR